MSQAIVIGGSIAGLLTARVLLDHFDHVTLLERDQLPDGPEIRPGVPQAQHVHALLLHGYHLVESLFPTLTTNLTAQGAQLLDWTNDWRFLSIWAWMPQHQSNLQGLICSRLLLEWYLRQQLLQHPGFSLKDQTRAQALVCDHNRITGVVINDKITNTVILQADLVVDASGRRSQLPDWLTELGYGPVDTTTVNSFLGYASRWYEYSPEDAIKGVIIASKPGTTRRGGVVYPVENNRCVITLSGFEKDYPSNREEEFLEFAKSLRDPAIYDAIQKAKPLSPIYCHRNTDNRLRHYEKLKTMPARLVSLGDAVCSFNPSYGQGMTVAGMGAMLLGDSLRGVSKENLNSNFSLQFQRKLAKIIEIPWMMATGEDFRWEMTTGDRPDWFTQKIQSYFDRVVQAATTDTKIYDDFIQVAHMAKSPGILFHPRTLLKALAQSPVN
ncbi:MAG: FAD-dependent monooxygenase [Cyanobacteria bacterium P01_B01_bin.77]